MGVLTFHWSVGQASSGKEKFFVGILGGPKDSSQDIETLFATISSQRAVAAEVASADLPPLDSVDTVDMGTLTQSSPMVTLTPSVPGSKMSTYTVQPGDTLTGIARRFSVSLSSIQGANPKISSRPLRVGDKLTISAAQPQLGSAVEVAQSAPPAFSGGYFTIPVNGLNWGILHHYNAVDIAAPCGTPVTAAADGLVVPDTIYGLGDGTSGWNSGYGKFVLLAHAFGTNIKTRYAHLEKILVPIGDYVKQGDIIGLTGETGDATGCHVHFEVYGAKNPFAK